MGQAALENSKQHDNEVLSSGYWLVLEACFASLTWTMAPRDANVNTLSSKISTGTVKNAGQNGGPTDPHWLASHENQEKLHDLV